MTFLPSSNNNNSNSNPSGNYHRYLTRRRAQSLLPVYFFMDVSNILYSGQQYLANTGQSSEERRLAQRIHIENFVDFARGQRQWGSGFACAGGNRQPDRVKEKFASVGVEFKFRENTRSGKEESVDECIRCAMNLMAYESDVPSGVVVLATGDGNDRDGDSFLKRLKALKAAGHHIELMSWSHSLHKGMRDWVWQNDGDVILLDHHWDSLTFEEGGRGAKPLPEWISGPNRRSA